MDLDASLGGSDRSHRNRPRIRARTLQHESDVSPSMRDSLVRGTVPSRASRSPPIPSAHAEWGDGVEGNDHHSSIEKQKRALWRITTAKANQTTAKAGSKTAGLAKFPRRMSWEMLGEQGVCKKGPWRGSSMPRHATGSPRLAKTSGRPRAASRSTSTTPPSRPPQVPARRANAAASGTTPPPHGLPTL